MVRSGPPGPDDLGPVRPSRRAQLAALALEAALEAEGAVAGHPGSPPVHVTQGPDGLLRGVAAVATPQGAYDVALHLVADPVPLYPLADRVRELVRGRAEQAGLAGALGRIDVAIEDVVSRLPPDPPAEGI